MNPEPPKSQEGNSNEPYLYTWNFFDGFNGLPRRKIDLNGLPSHVATLLIRAYLGGGSRWDNRGTPSGALLCLDLGSAHPQDNQLYYSFLEQYREGEFASTFSARFEDFSGGSVAEWSCEVPCAQLDAAAVDGKIVEILCWHAAEIDRIRNVGNAMVRSPADPD